ncbi:DnaD domain protein [Fructilactobacillus cliffordii]|uniref:replication initiation and membrane attachment family protein n=1 Tax=Fructilactobacillus cliffordii TaxID=2940299 RepID=UPI002092ADD3|nr:DnaD domain protein [Fructilactobacillus cliffordii]USS86750.1 DnaD domain protein [Fructilactobacillus cliffordii]
MMTNNQHSIDPQSKFQVLRAHDLTTEQRMSLDRLYLPMIGNDAYALINLLWHQSQQFQGHFALMSTLQIDAEALYQARLKLEGAGLLQVYTEQTQFHYRLVDPLTPVTFFQNDTLSQFLLEMVGENQFVELTQQLLPTPVDISNFDDQTHSFWQVFAAQPTADSALVQTTQKRAQATQSTGPKSDLPTIDLQLMLSILQSSFVNLADVKKNQPLFAVTKQLYGVEEAEMARVVEQATNLTTNHFDKQKFQLLIARKYQSTPATPSEPQITTTPASDKHTSFTVQERELLQVAETTAPVPFLGAIKQEKGGYATAAEERSLRQLLEQNVLPSAVVNMLIYLLLVDRENPTLNKNLLDTIANDWAQRHIQTADQALTEIKQRERRITKQRTKRTKQKQQTVKETLPEWAYKADHQRSTKQASAANRKLIKEKLAKLRNNQSEGSE